MTKAELPAAVDVCQSLQASLEREVLLISAITGHGLDKLLQAIVRELDQREHEPVASPSHGPI